MASPAAMRSAASGFTLIELMTTLTLVAIILAIGIPSMNGFIQSNRISSEMTAFAGDLQFARAEAIKQGIPVVLCASSNGTSCSGANAWQAGWIVYADVDSSGGQGSGESAIRARPAWRSSDTFTATPSMTSITFTRDGFATVPVGSGSAVQLSLRTAPINANATRCIQLNRLGHQAVLTGGTGGCS